MWRATRFQSNNSPQRDVTARAHPRLQADATGVQVRRMQMEKEGRKCLERELSLILASVTWDGPVSASWPRMIYQGWIGRKPLDRHIVAVHLLIDIFASNLPAEDVTDRRCVSRSTWNAQLATISRRSHLSSQQLLLALQQLELQGLVSMHKEKRPKADGRGPTTWLRVLPLADGIRRITVAPGLEDGWGVSNTRKVNLARRPLRGRQ